MIRQTPVSQECRSQSAGRIHAQVYDGVGQAWRERRSEQLIYRPLDDLPQSSECDSEASEGDDEEPAPLLERSELPSIEEEAQTERDGEEGQPMRDRVIGSESLVPVPGEPAGISKAHRRKRHSKNGGNGSFIRMKVNAAMKKMPSPSAALHSPRTQVNTTAPPNRISPPQAKRRQRCQCIKRKKELTTVIFALLLPDVATDAAWANL